MAARLTHLAQTSPSICSNSSPHAEVPAGGPWTPATSPGAPGRRLSMQGDSAPASPSIHAPPTPAMACTPARSTPPSVALSAAPSTPSRPRSALSFLSSLSVVSPSCSTPSFINPPAILPHHSDPERLEQPVPPGRPWQPYENQWTETPWLGGMRHFPRLWYRLRWRLTYPLQWRLPGGCFTLGELVCLVVLLGLAAAAMLQTHNVKPASGLIASVPMALTLSLANHNSIWTFLLGVPVERALLWHQVMAYLTVGMGLWHGLMIWRFGYQNRNVYGQDNSDGDAGVGDWELGTHDGMFISGWVLLGILILIVALTLVPWLRRAAYHFWKVAHMLLGAAAVCAAIAHFSFIVLFGLGLWLVDLLIRYVVMAGLRHSQEVELSLLTDGIVRIAWPRKSLQYSGGQYCFVCIPALSWFEWHPFSLSSHPDQQYVYMHVRVRGRWTRALQQLVKDKGQAGAGSACVLAPAFIEGPYGSPSADIWGDHHDMFLLISGGIGTTPMQSIASDLIAQSARGRAIKFLWFVWSVRESLELEADLEENKAGGPLPPSFCPNMLGPFMRTSRYAWRAHEGPERPNPGGLVQAFSEPEMSSAGGVGSKAMRSSGGVRASVEEESSDGGQQQQLHWAARSSGLSGQEEGNGEGGRGDELGGTSSSETGGAGQDEGRGGAGHAGPNGDVHGRAKRGPQRALPSPDADWLHTEFYLTQAKGQREFDAQHGRHGGQGQGGVVRSGRPDIGAIIRDMARIAAEKQPKSPGVAVLVCGPRVMEQEVQRHIGSGAVLAPDGTRVRFVLHTERFTF